jgi:hypothetical protein
VSADGPQWHDVQRETNSCLECTILGSSLMRNSQDVPVRPPQPVGGELLFLSEAPPASGGFWVAPPGKDDLRKNLFGCLARSGVVLPSPLEPDCLTRFASSGFSLLQTIKWPLRTSARSLRPSERRLIEHSAKAHLTAEVNLVKPVAIVALGRVACFACAVIFPGCGFNFERKTLLADVRGLRYDVQTPIGHHFPIYPAGLPVGRRTQDFDTIATELRSVIIEHWDTSTRHVRPAAPRS